MTAAEFGTLIHQMFEDMIRNNPDRFMQGKACPECTKLNEIAYTVTAEQAEVDYYVCTRCKTTYTGTE